MARFLAFFTLFHLSLTFFRPEVPFNKIHGDRFHASGVTEQQSLAYDKRFFKELIHSIF